ncbi:MAG: hypothetical protein ACXVHV_06985 [Methanobacterium sp.]
MNGKVAASDFNMAAGGQQGMTYIYEWPAGTSSSTTGKSSSIPKISNASTPTVSSKEAGFLMDYL